jgi:NAD+ synthase (glutamine-hydrolysing)
LWPNQTDQGSLPEYEVLDRVIQARVEERQSVDEIVKATGFEHALVARVCRMIDIAEYKRRQAAVGLKITSVAFGSGRRMPIAQKWRG